MLGSLRFTSASTNSPPSSQGSHGEQGIRSTGVPTTLGTFGKAGSTVCERTYDTLLGKGTLFKLANGVTHPSVVSHISAFDLDHCHSVTLSSRGVEPRILRVIK